jgi:hypothetical protein
MFLGRIGGMGRAVDLLNEAMLLFNSEVCKHELLSRGRALALSIGTRYFNTRFTLTCYLPTRFSPKNVSQGRY